MRAIITVNSKYTTQETQRTHKITTRTRRNDASYRAHQQVLN